MLLVSFRSQKASIPAIWSQQHCSASSVNLVSQLFKVLTLGGFYYIYNCQFLGSLLHPSHIFKSCHLPMLVFLVLYSFETQLCFSSHTLPFIVFQIRRQRMLTACAYYLKAMCCVKIHKANTVPYIHILYLRFIFTFFTVLVIFKESILHYLKYWYGHMSTQVV